MEAFLVVYGAAALLPLAVIEGPVVSVAAGALAARGDIAWPWALALLVLADLIGDLGLYWIGRSGAGQLGRAGRWLGADRTLPAATRAALAQDGTRLLLVGKWTHAIGAAVLIGAGAARMDLRRFVLVNLLATIPKSALLFAIGYFAWRDLGFFRDHVLATMLALLALGVASVLLILRRRGAASAAAPTGACR